MAATLEPVWFGSLDRPLAGYLHLPPAAVSGGVLICPPFGYEATCAHRSLRILAEGLAAEGNIVLRFHYEGTGASAGSGFEPDLLERWQRSVLAGVAELRARGVTQPALVGLRLGAALICTATQQTRDLGPIALWAPIVSGARYQRELRALSATNPWTVMADGFVNAAGHVVSPELSQALRAWQPFDALDTSLDVLLMESPGWRDGPRASAMLDEAGATPSHLEAAGTAEVLERDAELVVPPRQLLTSLATWLGLRSRQDPAAPPTAVTDAARSRVFDGGWGPVREEIVRVGPTGLHGVVTEAVGTASRHGVVFLNNGVETSDGPARAWVSFARELAADGVVSLRVDLSGLGNSPDPPGRRHHLDNPTSRTSAAEMLAAATFLRGRGAHDVTIVGLCSGAQIAVRGAAYLGGVDTVVAINAPLGSVRDLGAGPAMRRIWNRLAWLSEKQPTRRLLNRVPERLWSLLDRVGLWPSPARYLERAAGRGCRVTLVFAAEDRGLEDLEHRAGRRVQRLVDARRSTLQVVEGMDHSLFNVQSRRKAFDILHAACIDAEPKGL